MDSLTLKQKLLQSRKLWNELDRSSFLVDLYEITDDPKKDEIIAWSDDGKFLLLKDLALFDEEVIVHLESCFTIQHFFSKLKALGFSKVPLGHYKAQYAFKHPKYNRDKIPEFECLDERSKKSQTTLHEVSYSDSEETLFELPKKIQKTSQNSGTVIQNLDERNEREALQRESYKIYYQMHLFNALFKSALEGFSLQEDLEELFKRKNI